MSQRRHQTESEARRLCWHCVLPDVHELEAANTCREMITDSSVHCWAPQRNNMERTKNIATKEFQKAWSPNYQNVIAF